jgi:hypothetical protein
MNIDTLTLSRVPEVDRLEAQQLAAAFEQISGPITHAFE